MKLKPEYETECYITESGYYAIKQPHPYGEDDSIALLTKSQVQKVIKDMQEWLDIVGEWGLEED